MSKPDTAKSKAPSHSSITPAGPLPAHLRGSRDAIFHLLRQVTAAKVPGLRSETGSASAYAHPVRSRTPAAVPLACGTALRGFLEEDQFEFTPAEVRRRAARSLAASLRRAVAS